MKTIDMALGSTVLGVVVGVPLILNSNDSLITATFVVVAWWAAIITIAVIDVSRRRNYSSNNNSGSNSQIADYMATNQYFNNQAMRQDLDNMNQIAIRTEIQSRLDRLK